MNGKQARRIRRMVRKTEGTNTEYRRAKKGWVELPRSLKEKLGRKNAKFD